MRGTIPWLLLAITNLVGCSLIVDTRRECVSDDDFCPEGYRCDGTECVSVGSDGDADYDTESDSEVDGDIEPDGDTDLDEMACEEGQTTSCGTDTGICVQGVQTCEGGLWRDCEGGVQPGTETCDGELDEDCDGDVDEDCPCVESETMVCGTDVGLCEIGLKTCDDDGFWSPCEGSVEPVDEICNNEDDDCDETTDEGSNDCGGVCDLSAEPGDACDGSDSDLCEDDEIVCVGLNEVVCSAGTDDVETCNDEDDDCDGTTDEGSNECGGVCALSAAPGDACDGSDSDLCEDDEYECEGLNSVLCTTGEDNEETCNREDDDCDDEIDEGCSPPPDAQARFPWNGYTTGSPWAESGENLPLRPTFRWEEVASATDFELQVDDSCTTPGFSACAFPSPELSIITEETSFTPDEDLAVSLSPAVGRRYFWRVRACTGTACSSWTPVRYVDVGRQAQDFNGDGYADVVIGAVLQDWVAVDEGKVFVFYGSASGILATPSQTLDSPASQLGGHFGVSVASAGDVNGDGFSDLIVGASAQDAVAVDEGRVYVYYGSASGILASPSRTLGNPANQAGGFFGESVATAGDVNGDGFADVIVGAPRQDVVAVDEGRAFVYHGSASGIPASPSRRLGNPAGQADGLFGFSVASAGDVNGDGYVDVIVGAYLQDNVATDEGNAFVYHGSASGIPASPSRSLDSPTDQADGHFGVSVASVGDVNGDGFADLGVGANRYDNGAVNEGSAFLYLGSASGILASPSRTLDNPANQAGGNFGRAIAAAGDVNGDGFMDVIVGAELQDNGAENEGNAFLYYGSASGITTSPSLELDNPANQAYGQFGFSVASAGDVDGDGFADVVVGAHFQDAGAEDEGNAFVYHGVDSGIPDLPSLTLDNPANQAGGWFGYSVASVGDQVPQRERDVQIAGRTAVCLPWRFRFQLV